MNPLAYCPEEHYGIICSWWEAHNWPCIPEDHLPKTGFLIYQNEDPIIAGFVYKTDSAFCLFEFVVANPNVKGLRRQLAFDILIASVVQYSIDVGCKSLFTSVSNKGLMAKLESNGFIKTDAGMTNFIRRI